MKVFRWFCSLIVILCGSPVGFAQEAVDCSALIDRPTVFFVNGMYTDVELAEEARKDLKASYLSFINSLPNQDYVTDEMRCVDFRIAHNQKEEAWLDLLEAFVQSLSDDTVTFWHWVARSHGFPVPEWFKEKQLEISKAISSTFAYVIDEDLRKHVDVYAGTLGRRMVIAHSQGNYYATQANFLLPAYLRISAFAIATPEGSEPDRGYLTYVNDTVINSVREITGALPANAEGNCEGDWSCHGMREVYLQTDRRLIAWTIFTTLFPPVPL